MLFLIFRTLFCNVCLVNAISPLQPNGSNGNGRSRNNEIGDSEDGSRTYISIDGQAQPLHVFAREGTIPFASPTYVRTIKLINAPNGYGCFIWSRLAFASSMTGMFEATTRTSQTFYAENDEALEVNFAGAEFLTCFRLPNLRRTDRTLVIWYNSKPSDPSLMDPNQSTSFVRIWQYPDNDRFSVKSVNMAVAHTIYQAAVVHSPQQGSGPEWGCIVFSGVGEDERMVFTTSEPLARPMERVRLLLCGRPEVLEERLPPNER